MRRNRSAPNIRAQPSQLWRSSLRGSKMTDWEGGVRGLALVSSPLLAAARKGTVYAGLLHQTDVYVTFAKLAGVSSDALARSGPVPVDGIDIWEALTSGGASPRTELVHNIFGDHPGAIRVGRYKLLKGPPFVGGYNGYNCWNATACEVEEEAVCAETPCLYDMETDRAEQHDLAASQPALVKQLEARYAELAKSEVTLAASGLCPVDAPKVDGCTANRGGGVWAPWL